MKDLRKYKYALVPLHTMQLAFGVGQYTLIDLDILRTVSAYQSIFRALKRDSYTPHELSEYDTRFDILETCPDVTPAFAETIAFVGSNSDVPDISDAKHCVGSIEELRAIHSGVQYNAQLLIMQQNKFRVTAYIADRHIDLSSSKVWQENTYPSLATRLQENFPDWPFNDA